MVFYSKNIQTDNGKLITGYACDSRTADAEFLLAKRQYIAATGRVRGANDVIAYHVRQSFRPGEITLEEANRLGVEFARRFTKENHAFVVCTHIDKSHIHNHIIWSSVSLEYDRNATIVNFSYGASDAGKAEVVTNNELEPRQGNIAEDVNVLEIVQETASEFAVKKMETSYF